ncbi:hypothetical protein [Actinomadura decatromicini]|uniref:Uncharacterized protein n=1 Tax=Actinomadura decatromicini TaxID=2604572 RepID=A0A5D3FW84_9ACTN|nr:hypothetical protein [Actinomadura decatromicini]TYK53117.1 hypothetical protein FXF68_05155 [Actinomadura decatromicini]
MSATSEFDDLLDPEPPAQRPRTVLCLPPGSSLFVAANALEEVLQRDATVTTVALNMAERQLGTTSRAFLSDRFPGVTRSVGDADRASQPGESTQYRLLRFQCSQCDHQVFRTFYDERAIPACANAEHGSMVLRK